MPISSALGSSALLPGGLGFRNAIINGGFDINQRNFSSTTSDGAFGFDRWRLNVSGGTTTYSAQTFSLGNAIAGQEPVNFARIVTSGQSGAGDYSVFSQRIESCRTFAGQSVVISFWAKSGSGTPKVAIELQQNFGTGGTPSAEVNSYVGQATLSTVWTRYSFTYILPSIIGKTIGSGSNDSLRLGFFLSAGSSLDSRTGSMGLQSATFDFWGVQLEQNYQATPFEQRPIGVELALCQRYYYRITAPSAATHRLGTGFVYTTTAAVIMVIPPVTMRAAPTQLEQSGTASHYAVFNAGGSNVACNVVPVYDICTTSTLQATFQVASGLVAGNATIGLSNNTASAYLGWSAEL